MQRRDTQQRVRGATVEGLLASVNGAWEAVPARAAPRVQRVQATPAAPRVVKRQPPRPEELRAAAANRMAKLEELEAVGFRWSAEQGERPAVLQLYRPRLTAAARHHVCTTTGASFIIGDDPLGVSELRRAPLEADLLKVAGRWGESIHHPLLAFPLLPITRIMDRVHFELTRQGGVQAVTILLALQRGRVEAAADWDAFASCVGEQLVDGWGDGVGLRAVHVFLPPAAMRRIPAGCTVLPPRQWEEAEMPRSQVAVAFTVVREPAEAPTFARVGSAPTVRELRASCRAGVASVVVQFALIQRAAARGDLRQFTRRAVGELVQFIEGEGSAGRGVLLPPLRALQQQGDVVSGILDTTPEQAERLIRASGAIRGVFVRPLFHTSPASPGAFSEHTHRVVWVSAEAYSDVVFGALARAHVEFAGLVCGRARRDVGVRVREGADCTALQATLEQQLRARVRPWGAARKTRLRAYGVPVCLIHRGELGQLVAAVDPELRFEDARILEYGAHTAVVELTVTGSLEGDRWLVSRNEGLRPVRVQRVAQRPAAGRVPLAPSTATPQPQRSLTAAQAVTWAAVVWGEAAPAEAMEVAGAVMEDTEVEAPPRPRAQTHPPPPAPVSPPRHSAPPPHQPLPKAPPAPTSTKGIRAWCKPAAPPAPAPPATTPSCSSTAAGSPDGGMAAMQAQLAQVLHVLEQMQRDITELRERNSQLELENATLRQEKAAALKRRARLTEAAADPHQGETGARAAPLEYLQPEADSDEGGAAMDDVV